MDTKINQVLLICKKNNPKLKEKLKSNEKLSKLRQKSQNLSNKTQNSSEKLKVSANSFARVAENRSKLEA